MRLLLLIFSILAALGDWFAGPGQPQPERTIAFRWPDKVWFALLIGLLFASLFLCYVTSWFG